MRTKTALLVTAAITVFSISIGGALAYYAAQTKTVENSFNIVAGGGASGDTVGTVDETFDPAKAVNAEPRSVIQKEAALNSNVDYSAYGYIYVTVPNANAKKGSETVKSYQDAVTLDVDTLNWTLVKSTAGSDSVPSKYLYRYKTILAAKQVSSKLFTKATVPDFTEADAVSGSIDVTGYLLSSTNVSESEADAAAVANFWS